LITSAERRENNLPTFEYRSGLIEVIPESEKPIRSIICEILEGGEAALMKREKRYHISMPGIIS